jgi:hypothetical protein
MPTKFNERFGIDLGVAEGKRRFVNRVLNFLFGTIMRDADEDDPFTGKAELEKYICSKLGERYAGLGSLERLIGHDFDKCLITIEALFAHSEWREHAETGIQGILAETEVDIGIQWKNGQFRSAGAPALDAALVSDPLNLLVEPEYKGISDAFKKGLDHFLHSTKKPALLADVLTDMYESLEALAKVVCKNEKDRDLSGNCESFISAVGLADPYKRMLKEYIKYANDFGRHAGQQGKPKPLPSRREVEAFMYLTGLFIRVAISKDS